MRIFLPVLLAAVLCIGAAYVFSGADIAMALAVIAFPIVALIYYDRFISRR